MRPEKRRQGNAIRKQRREIETAIKVLSSVDWNMVLDGVVKAMNQLCLAFLEVGRKMEQEWISKEKNDHCDRL